MDRLAAKRCLDGEDAGPGAEIDQDIVVTDPQGVQNSVALVFHIPEVRMPRVIIRNFLQLAVILPHLGEFIILPVYIFFHLHPKIDLSRFNLNPNVPIFAFLALKRPVLNNDF